MRNTKVKAIRHLFCLLDDDVDVETGMIQGERGTTIAIHIPYDVLKNIHNTFAGRRNLYQERLNLLQHFLEKEESL